MNDLPHKFRQSEHGSLIVESVVIAFGNKNAKDLITAIDFEEWDIEILEDQAVIIPLN